MARKGGEKLGDPIGGTRQVNHMPSGLVHTADSMAGGRGGTVIMRFGSPGDPLEKSHGASSDLYGKAPNLLEKFSRRGQH